MLKFIFSFFLLLSISNANEKVILQLKWLHQFQFAGYYTALEKGFYNDVGLDVEIRQRDLGKNNIDQVLNNEAQYGISDSILLLYRAQNKPVVIISPIFQHSPSVILTLKSGGLDSPYKLNGKKLVFYEKDTDGFGILSMLKGLNLTPNLLRTKNKTNYIDLIDGKVDAYSAYISNEPFYFKERGIKINIINPANYGSDLYGDILFTSEHEAKNNPKRVEKFKEATLRGWNYALRHKEEIITLIKNKYAKNKSIEHLRYEANAIEQMSDFKTVPLGTLDKGRLEYTVNLYTKFGLIDKKIPIDDYIFESFKNKKTLFNFNSKEIEFLNKKTELRVCIDPDWMPFEKIENGKHIGMSADYLKIISKEIKTPIKLVPTKSWEESLLFGKQRKCDIFSLIMKNEERKKYLLFTEPYINEPMALATNINELFISDFENIKNKKIGIVKEYALNKLLRNTYKNITFIDVKNISNGLELVKDGKLFGMVDSLSTLGYQIQKSYIGQLKISTKLDLSWNLSIGIRNDQPKLLSILNKVLDKISHKDKQNILNKWVSINYEKGTNYIFIFKWIIGIISIFSVIVFFIVRTNRRLSKEVQSRLITEQKLTRYIDLVDKYIIISSTDLSGKITDVSEAFCKVSGYSKKELIGKTHSIIKSPEVSQKFYKQMWKELLEKDYWKGEIKNKSKTGKFYWVSANISSIFDINGNKIGYTSIRQNITDKKLVEELSITDELTKIHNRRHFNNIFPKLINSSKRNNELLCFAILDVDFFKLYNDTYGHQEGDKVLISIAHIMVNKLNRADDFSFRLGGEEFGLLFKSNDLTKSINFVKDLKKEIENMKIEHKNSIVSKYVTVSIGVVIKKVKDISSIDNLYKEADDLLYRAKENGRNTVQTNS